MKKNQQKPSASQKPEITNQEFDLYDHFIGASNMDTVNVAGQIIPVVADLR